MENILFRRAIRPADWKKISELSQELGRFQKDNRIKFEPAELESMGSRSRPLFCSVVAEENTQIVGHLAYMPTYAPYCSRTAYTNLMFVDPQFRRKSLALNLMKWTLNDSLKYKCKQTHGCVKRWNTPSRNLLAKFEMCNMRTAHGHHEQLLSTPQAEALPNPKLPYALIRLATNDDCQQIANFVKTSKNHKISLNMDHITKQQLEEDGFGTFPFFQALVAEDSRLKEKGVEDSIIGCSIFTQVFGFFYGRMLHLAGLYVKPEYDSDRLDMKLWNSLTQFGKATDSRGILFTTSDQNNSHQYASEIDAFDYATKAEFDNMTMPLTKTSYI